MATDTTRSTVSPFESWSKKNGGQVTVSNMPKTTPKKQKPERLAQYVVSRRACLLFAACCLL
jgi:hypothetical protein